MNIINKKLNELLKDPITLKLDKENILQSLEYLKNFEYELCFENIVTQLYENDIKIDTEYYEKIKNVAINLHVESDEYKYLKELINRI